MNNRLNSKPQNRQNFGSNFQNSRLNSHGNSSGKKPRIQAPYRFISLNEKIFYPSDFGEIKDNEISFDKPVKDGVSGVLELKLIAKSDIFTGDFLGKKEADSSENSTQNSNSSSNSSKNSSQNLNSSSNSSKNSQPQNSQNPPKDFFKIDGKHAFSGSSVRGVIRSICEVLGFAKFTSEDALEISPELLERIAELKHSRNAKKLEKARQSLKRAEEFKQKFTAIKENYKSAFDMVERVFGAVNGDKALKSRVAFSHFMLTKPGQPPKFINARYILMKGAKVPDILGYKFYVSQEIRSQNGNTAKNQDVVSTIRPLGKGSEFTGLLRYFNLTKAEFGLVLLALIALKNQGYKFGGAKYYGYGDMKMDICEAECYENGAKIELKSSKDKAQFFNECVSKFKDLLRKNGFDIDKRLDILRQTATQNAK